MFGDTKQCLGFNSVKIDPGARVDVAPGAVVTVVE